MVLFLLAFFIYLLAVMMFHSRRLCSAASGWLRGLGWWTCLATGSPSDDDLKGKAFPPISRQPGISCALGGISLFSTAVIGNLGGRKGSEGACSKSEHKLASLVLHHARSVADEDFEYYRLHNHA